MVVRSSLHRTKYSRGRPNASQPDTWRALPPELLVERIVPYDAAAHDLRGRVTALVAGVEGLGRFRDAARPRLEDFAMSEDAWHHKDKQAGLTDAVLADAAFLAAFERFVVGWALPHVKSRLAAADAAYAAPTTFYYQRPPTLRLQPGPSERFVACHDDARYGHQPGELNFWLPLTDVAETRTTLEAESAPGRGDFHALAPRPGEVAVFHGTLCRHRVPPNPSACTRASLDFRVGVEGCFDPAWVLRGTLDDHHRSSVVL